ncbi:saccharopine dehydrogenase NADP-binding domain-containing protein [Kribbella sp.]|uniref:saccharopine dehydrogenase NADP-binding domain-containing protein n=1 Tax=Kribbella sp. TaxID=1871183 RepID=UPI002D348EFE|nr:saccharopine dehydrogenase NADP-binding domain-containing protein [Kribbella sp.]HZX06153.1 saccharopine dehydrogenase NADP-binding domain-containing protein [Kribbella sp.]
MIWILGATGRTGREIAARVAARGGTPVLVGRNAERLRKTAAELGLDGAEVVETADLAAAIAERRPAVVVNTIGGYAETAVRFARACLPGGHYVDLANDLVAMPRLLALHDEAVAAGSTFVTGAGFGVLGTEAVVAWLCADRPAPRTVRVDALPSVAITAGQMGEALAQSIVSGLTTGGRRYEGGRMVPARLAADPRTHVLPDGQTAKSAAGPTGELLAAHLASGAPDVVATTGLLPTGPLVRAIVPAAGALLKLPALQRFAVRRMAAMEFKPAPRPREHSWGHAVVTWADGTTREAWLRAEDAMDFTTNAAAETAVRLARGEGRRGAYTPACALGPELAEAAGATIR